MFFAACLSIVRIFPYDIMIKDKMKISPSRKFLIFLVVFFLCFILFSLNKLDKNEKKEKEDFRADILVFAPHPDDEVLCCGGTISKAIAENKKVKVIFLTNGDAHVRSALIWTGKEQQELKPEDCIALGKERQKEALGAGKKMGLEKDDLVFLSYPDSGLSLLWSNSYDDFYLSETINATSSPYKLTYNLAKQGYTKENLTADIKEILEKYQPKKIYLPHLLDSNKDHQAANEFIFSALNALEPDTADWLSNLNSFHYLIHDFIGLEEDFYPYDFYLPYVFSREPNCEEDISGFKDQKNFALKEYHTQMNIKEKAEFFIDFIKDVERFWNMPLSPLSYLGMVEREWESIAQIMSGHGYNVNFSPVVDIAENIEDFSMPLTRNKRIYSEDPEIVTELATAAIAGMNKGGIIPTIKHFPGFGRVSRDTHVWLPETETSREDLYQRDLMPFISLIEKKHKFWIMIDHSIYLSLDEKPASLSYEVQTKLLREELGFEGIIIADELLAMQAIREYTFRQGITDHRIGEIITQVFIAGGDIALFYVPSSSEAKKVIDESVRSVKKAISENKISQKKIDDSVKRILAEKENIFGAPLLHLINDMSLEEKIAQKLMTDIYLGRDEKEINNWKNIIAEYNIGGIHARDQGFISEIQAQAKIPIFITGQHEGGMVNQYGLNIQTNSAYMTGKELEFLKKRAGIEISYNIKKETENFYKKEEKYSTSEKIDEAVRQNIIDILIDSVGELMASYSNIIERGYTSPNPNYLSPLTIFHDTGGYEVKHFYDLPVFWLRKFPNQEVSLHAYFLFDEIFKEWKKGQEELSVYTENIISNLSSLKEKIEGKKSIISDPRDKEKVRILFLATHPDDEDSEGLAYFKYKFNSETYILLATGGEGGEKQVNGDENLRELRRGEMEKAAGILKVNKVYHVGLEDFGHCVLQEEALDRWGKEDVMKKIVYFYRLIKPHIIISKNTIFDEHCQHKVFVSLSVDAFDLASDSEAYPEMLKNGLSPWQPLKFYQRDQENREEIFIDISERDAATGRTYKEIALDSLSQHQSQKLGQWAETQAPFWPDKIYYQIIKTKIKEGSSSIFSGINREDL